MAIASFSTRLLIALGFRVRRLDRRLSATFKRLIQSELRLLITWLTHVWSYNPISAIASVTTSADCHAGWTTGERASGTPGTPVVTLSADTPGRLQRCSAGIFTGFCLTSVLDYHVCWITGERASDTPGPSAATRTSDTAGRLKRFSACYFIGARRTSDLERQACSNFTATCPAFYLERNACWTTGERASATPGSPVASLFSDTLGRPQHPLDCCFFSACRIFHWDRNACWTTGGRASDTPGSPAASLSPGTLGRPQRFLNCTSAYPQHDYCIVEVVVAYILPPLYVTPLIYFEMVTSSPLVARLQHTMVSAAVPTATRKVRPTHGFTATKSLTQGLAATTADTTLLPLMLLPTHSSTSNVRARQSVGNDGDANT